VNEVLRYLTVVLLYDRLRLYSWWLRIYSKRSLECVAGSVFLYLKIFGEADRLSQQILIGISLYDDIRINNSIAQLIIPYIV
jgi:hypothetical protein